MHDISRVGEGDSVTDFLKYSQRIGESGIALFINIEAEAFDEFHRVKHVAVRQDSRVMNRHNAGMLELREDARFFQKSLRRTVVQKRLRRLNDFQRDTPAEDGVFGFEDSSHSAVPGRADNAIPRTSQVR